MRFRIRIALSAWRKLRSAGIRKQPSLGYAIHTLLWPAWWFNEEDRYKEVKHLSKYIDCLHSRINLLQRQNQELVKSIVDYTTYLKPPVVIVKKDAS